MNTKAISVQTTCIGYLERRTVGNFARSAQEVCVVKCRVIVTSIEKGSIVFVDWTVARGNLVIRESNRIQTFTLLKCLSIPVRIFS